MTVRRALFPLLAPLLLAVTGCRFGPRHPPGASPAGPFAGVRRLTAPRRSVHAYGRTGDLVLAEASAGGATLVIADAPDLAGHRALRGAVLDAFCAHGDVPDPLLWWRAAWIDRTAVVHPCVATAVHRVRCAATVGVRIDGTVDGVDLSTVLCAVGNGMFTAVTRATGLPPGARLGDEVVPGTADVLLEHQGRAWEGAFSTRWMVLSEVGTALVFAGDPFTAVRHRVHIATETFPAPVVLLSDRNGAVMTRTVRVLAGDALDGLAAAVANDPASRHLFVRPPDARGGSLEVLADSSTVWATGTLPRGARSVILPQGYGTAVRLRDLDGLPGSPVLLSDSGETQSIEPPVGGLPRAMLEVSATDPSGVGLPVHVLVHGLDETPDPMFASLRDGKGYVSGRSLYLTQGHGTVGISPGTYRVTVSHGPGWTLRTDTVNVSVNTHVGVSGLLRPVTPPGWIAADLHLHAAPSPDAAVSLGERVASLACNGVELAVATDHNRITDYAPAVRSERLGQWLTTVAGDEVSSVGPTLWGHFNAFPLRVPTATEAPEDVVPVYANVSPAQMFAAARAAGAAVIQVNHPRMPPQIGYFDLAHLDLATGHADASFSDGFDTVEAFNGVWLTVPDRVREGAIDLVALARRGHRVTATGNSDSHRLLYEEAGYPRTWIHPGAGATVVDRAIAGLRAGATIASSGPFVQLTVIGATVATEGGTVRVTRHHTVVARVRVTAPAWVPVDRVEIWVNGVTVRTFAVETPAVDGVRFEGEVTLSIPHDALLMAWADAAQPLPDVVPYANARAIGFGTPIGVDADGDGHVVPPPTPSPQPAPN